MTSYRTRRIGHAVLALGLLALPATLSAHRQWLLPSATIFSGKDDWVSVDYAISNDLFFADHHPGSVEQIKVYRPDGSAGTLEHAATGRYRSVFDVHLDRPGTWKIATESSAFMGSFKVNGEERRIGRRGPPRPDQPAPLTIADIPTAATDIQVTELIARNEIFVTAGAPTRQVLTPSGKGLELDPITHPDELVAGEPARFRFLVDGRPAPGLTLTLIPGGKRYRDAEDARTVISGADGVATVTFPAAGMYWLNATASDAKVSNPRATARRLSYTSTLEVMTP
ncbi:DUF4198 domain-containing protein [Sphingomonas sp. DT-51]|uniref:DUF4198 domain-containing protein n=1 Tax=Sphingomonas sp. DT-51 TaxID=3396165 RepID=UPI003F1AF9EB